MIDARSNSNTWGPHRTKDTPRLTVPNLWAAPKARTKISPETRCAAHGAPRAAEGGLLSRAREKHRPRPAGNTASCGAQRTQSFLRGPPLPTPSHPAPPGPAPREAERSAQRLIGSATGLPCRRLDGVAGLSGCGNDVTSARPAGAVGLPNGTASPVAWPGCRPVPVFPRRGTAAAETRDAVATAAAPQRGNKRKESHAGPYVCLSVWLPGCLDAWTQTGVSADQGCEV